MHRRARLFSAFRGFRASRRERATYVRANIRCKYFVEFSRGDARGSLRFSRFNFFRQPVSMRRAAFAHSREEYRATHKRIQMKTKTADEWDKVEPARQFCRNQEEARGSQGGLGRGRKGGREEGRSEERLKRERQIGQRAAASHAKQKSLSLRLNMIPHLLSMYQISKSRPSPVVLSVVPYVLRARGTIPLHLPARDPSSLLSELCNRPSVRPLVRPSLVRRPHVVRRRALTDTFFLP